MATADQTRIERDRANPRMMQLWWALRPLMSVVRFMQSGAHPDDEMSGLLAALAFRDGVNLSYACSTRGEGGQNDIGKETGAALGALRTREMERACDVLGIRMYWHSETAGDTITDFGFSKNGDETFNHWGRDRTLARFVEIVRTERPDILCPTFLDVPGQHGHHRAMTQAAHDVMAAAADPGFPSNLEPWQIKKLYLPATSGAGQAYDDDEPPPPATLVIDGSGLDPASGWSWNRIGQQSRAFHRTQGMGRWVSAGEGQDWKLHLAESHVPGPDRTLTEGLPADLAALAQVPGADPIAGELKTAQASIDAAIGHFPDYAAVAKFALAAINAVRTARDACPEAVAGEVAHRLAAKETQLSHVLRIALGVEVRARVENVFLRPGDCTAVTVELDEGDCSVTTRVELPKGWSVTDGTLMVGTNASITNSYLPYYDPAEPAAPCLSVEMSVAGTDIMTRVPFEATPIVQPARSIVAEPMSAVLNLAEPGRDLDVAVRGVHPAGADSDIGVPDGWTTRAEGDDHIIQAPKELDAGLYHLPLRVGGKDAFFERRIEHGHVAPTATAHPANIVLRALRVEVPDVQVGYIGAGNDRVDHWLRTIGADVRAVTDADLTSDAALAKFDTIVVGIFAMRFRPGLAAAMPRVHRWTEAGGTLVTLYHRPWDGWDPETVPPKRLEIGQPSLRWRVTDQNADVRHLVEHDLLSYPNQIGPDDWAGWVKERGLYFAKSWDSAYVPLLEMADPEETPHQGSLLAADIGGGRHVHTSLILHHQMENLVPGAFRLMANLIARGR